MIDMHCHLLFGVDDGSPTIEESVKMLVEAKNQGIDKIILTPHYRHGMFAYPKEKIEENFEKLKPYGEKLGIQIYLGTEYHVNSQIVEAFQSGRCHTLADTRYVLTEYAHHSEYTFIKQMTQELIHHGYRPIIAHVERYGCMVEDVGRASELQEMGALIQSNADAVLGLEGHGPKKYCKKLLKEGRMDMIASDSHGIEKRTCNMAKCFAYVGKKYGAEYANELFAEKPAEIWK